MPNQLPASTATESAKISADQLGGLTRNTAAA